MADSDAVTALVDAYFSAWNAQDAAKLRECFDENVSLTDWDVAVSGIDAVVEANQGIWKAVPKIQIEVVSIFTCGEAKSCVANIKVIVDETTTTLTLNPKPSP